jgi:3,4-dihydroxy-2-butanone 4-phosphate synthase
MEAHSAFSSIPDALDAIRKGKYVVVMDDENRENEGPLLLNDNLFVLPLSDSFGAEGS